jgi:hypothetical protein
VGGAGFARPRHRISEHKIVGAGGLGSDLRHATDVRFSTGSGAFPPIKDIPAAIADARN